MQTFFTVGLSKSGISATRFLLAHGAKVFIYDDATSERIEKTVKDLETLGAVRVDKETAVKMPERCDAIVLSPGIPIDHPLAVAFKRKGKAVLGETELAARYMRARIVAVTGTNGKTTTVSILGDIFKKSGIECAVCGNVGTPMLDFTHLDENAVAVTEISSFQLETLASIRPHIAIVLNVTEDHLNRHYNMENYLFLKARLLKNMTETEYAVLNYDDENVRAFAEKTRAKTLWISLKERVPGAYLYNGELWYFNEKIMSADDLFAGGLHNAQNALACICAAKLMGIETQTLVSVLSNFKGIKHRIQTVEEIDGVQYIDDSKATNPDACVKALETMKRDTILLLGGKSKGYDYTGLFTKLKATKTVHAVLYGENRYELLSGARKSDFSSVSVCENFEFAVRVAALKAKENQTVLLSPASASFDEFSGYEERGDAFIEIVRSLRKEEQPEEEDEEEVQPIFLDEE